MRKIWWLTLLLLLCCFSCAQAGGFLQWSLGDTAVTLGNVSGMGYLKLDYVDSGLGRLQIVRTDGIVVYDRIPTAGQIIALPPGYSYVFRGYPREYYHLDGRKRDFLRYRYLSDSPYLPVNYDTYVVRHRHHYRYPERSHWRNPGYPVHKTAVHKKPPKPKKAVGAPAPHRYAPKPSVHPNYREKKTNVPGRSVHRERRNNHSHGRYR